ncbi:MAG: DUF1003 domain-containing protein [Bacteroidota bacterium]
MAKSTWHDKHKQTLHFGDKVADSIASVMGSWNFLIWQTVIVAIWMLLNVVAYVRHWDPYPFILLNLLFSTQAAYAAPLIMMSQNRQAARDRIQAEDDYTCNIEAKQEIEALQIHLSKIETEKLDKLITMLQEMKTAQQK